jgi:CheY-like chemotaxis protein
MNEIRPILLAEDDPRDVELTLRALSELNLANRIDVVRDGAEAVDYLFRQGAFQERTGPNPAVSLLDLKMPKLDGIEVLRRIKADPTLYTLPVVVLTSSREEEDLSECYALGANAYVVKPVRPKELAEAVKQTGVFWALINELPAHRA